MLIIWKKSFVTVVLQELLDKVKNTKEYIAIGSLSMIDSMVNVIITGLHTMVS